MFIYALGDEYGLLQEVWLIDIDNKDIFDDREIALCLDEQVGYGEM